MILNRQGEAGYSRMFSEHPSPNGGNDCPLPPGRNMNAKKDDIG